MQSVNSEGGKQEIEFLEMKSLNNTHKLFAPQQGDEFLANKGDVIAILPTSAVININGKVKYSFEKEVNVFEM